MRRMRGLLFVELLIVVAIIAILAAILFPAFARTRERARQYSCLNNMVNIGLALQLYADDHGGLWPPTEDDLSPLASRYLREKTIFTCPSSSRQDIPMGAPANPDLLPSSDDDTSTGMAPSLGPPPTMPGQQPGTSEAETAERETEEPLVTNYYYRAGHGPYETPAAPIVSDQAPHHNERANVLYSDGHTKALPEQPWRNLGFKPIDELLPEPDGDQDGLFPAGPPSSGAGGGSG